MEHDPEMEESDVHIRLSLRGEVWLEGRELPIDVPCYHYYMKNSGHYPNGKYIFPRSVEEITDQANEKYEDVLDRKSNVYYSFEDGRHGKVIVKVDRIDAIKIYPPEEYPARFLEIIGELSDDD